MIESNKNQCIVLENKSILRVNGVEGVVNLTDQSVSVLVIGETLEVKGSNLKAEKLSVETGELVLNGNITSIKFEEQKEKRGLIKRIFK